jgi:hypothetical protein
VWLGLGLLNLLSKKRKKRTVGSHSVLVVKFFVPSFTILSFYSFCRSRKVHNSKRELAVMAAAASIYSTSIFLVSENVCWLRFMKMIEQADIASVMRK